MQQWFRTLLACLATSIGLAMMIAVPRPVAAAQMSAVDSPAQRVVLLINAEREKAGVPLLTADPSLMQAAQEYAGWMARTGCFSHNCGPIPDMTERLEVAGYAGWAAVAENIAMGYETPESVVTSWMSSPGHRANILDPNLRDIGVGLALGGSSGSYWAQEFGARMDGSSATEPTFALQPIVTEPEAAPEPADPPPAEEEPPAPDAAAETPQPFGEEQPAPEAEL